MIGVVVAVVVWDEGEEEEEDEEEGRETLFGRENGREGRLRGLYLLGKRKEERGFLIIY